MSPVEQYTIDCEYLAYFEPKNENYKRDIVRLFLRKLQYFKIILDFIFATENIKKDPKKLLIIGPQFFQYCQPAQMSFSVA